MSVMGLNKDILDSGVDDWMGGVSSSFFFI